MIFQVGLVGYTDPITALKNELSSILASLVAGHDVLPFMTRLHAASAVRLAPIPTEMAAIMVASPDYRPIAAGAPASWVQIASDAGSAELILYRARTDDSLYVVVPLVRDSPDLRSLLL